MTLTLYPYELSPGLWVFDDREVGLKEEAFVFGISEMITSLIEKNPVPDASQGFRLTFSATPFDHQVELMWQATGDGSPIDSPGGRSSGNWYAGEQDGEEMKGWLCPALFHYFESTPMKIYVRVDPLPEGVDPIWQVEDEVIDRTVVRGSEVGKDGVPAAFLVGT